jgi:hypothetical protein
MSAMIIPAVKMIVAKIGKLILNNAHCSNLVCGVP